MVERERFAVHPDREHRVAAVHDVLDRRAERHAVHGTGHQLVGVAALRRRPHPALGQQIGQVYAEPAGGAEVGAADLVRDAGQGDVPFDERACQELVEGVGTGPADSLSADAQPPGAGVDHRDGECGVDAVEVPDGRGERADAVHLQLRTGRNRGSG